MYRSERPLLSICCAAYNHEKYIAKTIQGFLDQKTDFPFEIIIHDDASTDKTAHIVKEFIADWPGRIHGIFQDENRFSKKEKVWGRYVWPRINGQYVAACDGDDCWVDPSKLQKQVEFLEQNEEYVVCYHDATIVDENDQVIRDSKMSDRSKKDFSGQELRRGANLLTVSIVFRHVFKELPPEYFMSYNGDRFITSILGTHGKGKYIGEVKPAMYRVHNKSMWSSKSDLRKRYLNNDTRAWLYRYFKRMSQHEDAKYLKEKFIRRHKYILKDISAAYDETNASMFQRLIFSYNDIVDEKASSAIRERCLRVNPSLKIIWPNVISRRDEIKCDSINW